jgi:hypothetical protein
MDWAILIAIIDCYDIYTLHRVYMNEGSYCMSQIYCVKLHETVDILRNYSGHEQTCLDMLIHCGNLPQSSFALSARLRESCRLANQREE